MRPTYEELVSLNPLLAKKKTPREIEELVDAIEDCGYRWEPKNKTFYNTGASGGIRTQGLDLFTPQSFREMHDEIGAEAVKYPVQDAHMRLYSYWNSKMLAAISLWFLGGWLMVGWKLWIFVLLGLIACNYVFDVYCSSKMRMPEEWVEEQRKKYSPPNTDN